MKSISQLNSAVKFSSIFLALQFALCALAHTINIPDPNLKQAMLEALGRTEGDLTDDDLAGITRLWIDSKGVRDLEGLQHATNLVDLNLVGNPTTNYAPISLLPKLFSLGIGGQNLTNISFLFPLGKSLDGLSLFNNPTLRDAAPLNTLTNLRNLQLGQTRVTNLSLVNLPNLDALSVPEVPIYSLTNLFGFPNLRTLNVEVTQLQDLSAITNWTEFDFLAIGANFFPPSQLELLAHLEGVRWLGVPYLNIRTLDFVKNIKGLRSLNISGNRGITSYAPVMNEFRLDSIYLNDLPLGNLSVIKDLFRLRDVYAHGSSLTNISAITNLLDLTVFHAADNFLSNLSPLHDIRAINNVVVHNNRLITVPGSPDGEFLRRLVREGKNTVFGGQTVTVTNLGIERYSRELHIQGPAGATVRVASSPAFGSTSITNTYIINEGYIAFPNLITNQQHFFWMIP